MARSSILAPTEDLQSDSGSVLWSLVMGEQLEFPITLNFLTNAGLMQNNYTEFAYTYEAVIVEALNVADQATYPTTIRPSGVQTVLTVRVPPEKGVWQSQSQGGTYNKEDVVYYNTLYYKLHTGSNYQSNTTPDTDTAHWAVYIPNKVYIQFPAALGSAWTVKPTAVTEVYGFFELRVTEPTGGVFQRTWKPMRGLVSLIFSPTDIVADV